MLEKMIWDYVKARYLSEKGQGMIEYALLMAFAVAIGVAVYNTSGTDGLRGALTSIVTKVTNALNVQTSP